MKHHPSSLVWFRYHADDLPLFLWFRFRVHVARCAACSLRLREEKSERARVEAVLNGARPAPSRRLPIWFGIPAVLGGAAVLFFLFAPRPKIEPGVEPDLREKGGGSSFFVFVKHDGGVLPISDACIQGDALQAQYKTDKAHVLVVGVDPEGEVRTLFPLDGTESTRAGVELETLPQSWVLDDVLGRERFVAFFSDEPLEARRAHAIARESEPPPPGVMVVVRQCTKVAP